MPTLTTVGPDPVTFDLVGDETTIGRHPDCTIVIDSGAVSRMHAKVIRDGGSHWVEDAGSRNGTLVNGRPTSGRLRLRDGDTIGISDVQLKFGGEPAAESSEPSVRGADDGLDSAFASPAAPPGSMPAAVEGGGSHLMTFDGGTFDVSVVDDESPNVEFSAGGDSGGVRMTASPEAKLRALLQINRQLGRSLALDQVLPGILDSLFEIFPAADRGCVVTCRDDGSLVPRWVKSRYESADDDGVRISRTIVRTAMETGDTLLSLDAAEDSRFDSSQSIADYSIRSLLCAPLVDADGRAFGALQIDSSSGRGQFREDDVDLFAGVAAQAGILIDNAAMHERALAQAEVEQDLRLATDVQKAFLPADAPAIDGYEIAAHYQAAHHIGGDYYDYVPLSGGRHAVIVADVVGHGIAAAMFMAKLAAETRFNLAATEDAGEAIERLNDALSRLMVDRFVTFVMVIVDPAAEHIDVVNAGHMPPVIRRFDGGGIEEPGEEEAGLPLAIAEGMDYESVRVPFARGDVLMMYTDGVNEAMNASDEEFGMERVRRIVAHGGSASNVVKNTVNNVAKFIGDTPPFDDMAVVAVRRS